MAAESEPSSRWAELPTEQRNKRSSDLDLLESVEVVELLLDEDGRGLEQASQCSSMIAKAADWFAETYQSGRTVLFAGAGTSGRLGVIEAAECPPTFSTDPDRIRAVIAGGSEAVFRSKEGAEDSAQDGARAVAGLCHGDLLIGLSASSVTPYVLGALESARAVGARTVLVTCASTSRIEERIEETTDLVIALDTGPEILTGSTRLKAGSATKATLNAITTAAMVRAGKVHGHLMVDVSPSCAKLEDRATRIVAEIASVDRDAARRLLSEAGGDVKSAVVMACCGLSHEAAVDRLKNFGGNLRAALKT